MIKNIQLWEKGRGKDRIIVDGKDLTEMCTGFSVDYKVGDVPRVRIDLIGWVTEEGKAMQDDNK